MTTLWSNAGKLVEVSGTLCEKATCPCGGTPGTINCCFTTLLPACLTFSPFTTLVGPGCQIPVCATTLAGTFNCNYSAGSCGGGLGVWNSDFVTGSDCGGGTQYRAVIQISSSSPTQCLVRFLFMYGGSALAQYDGTFLKASGAPPFTLTYIASTQCNSVPWPATMTLIAC